MRFRNGWTLPKKLWTLQKNLAKEALEIPNSFLCSSASCPDDMASGNAALARETGGRALRACGVAFGGGVARVLLLRSLLAYTRAARSAWQP